MAQSCPINFKKLDENQIRIQAFFIALTALGFILTDWIAFVFILVYDFTVKIFLSSKFSLFAYIAQFVMKCFNISKQLLDSAPKIFALKIGLAFSFLIVLASFFGMNELATIFAIILALFAGMEAFFNYCVGCKFYSILRYFNIV